MAFTLSQFSSELRQRNISRPNQYYIEIIAPPALAGKVQSDTNLVSMWCSAAQTPHTFLMTNDNFIEAGVRRKYAYDVDFQNLVLNFYIDQEYKVKQFFDTWKQAIVPYHRKFQYPDSYTAEKINLYILDQTDTPTYKYEYSRVYPKTINSTELTYAGGNSIAALNVEFVFEDVYYEAISPSASWGGEARPRTATSKPEVEIVENQEFGNTELTATMNPQDRH